MSSIIEIIFQTFHQKTKKILKTRQDESEVAFLHDQLSDCITEEAKNGLVSPDIKKKVTNYSAQELKGQIADLKYKVKTLEKEIGDSKVKFEKSEKEGKELNDSANAKLKSANDAIKDFQWSIFNYRFLIGCVGILLLIGYLTLPITKNKDCNHSAVQSIQSKWTSCLQFGTEQMEKINCPYDDEVLMKYKMCRRGVKLWCRKTNPDELIDVMPYFLPVDNEMVRVTYCPLKESAVEEHKTSVGYYVSNKIYPEMTDYHKRDEKLRLVHYPRKWTWIIAIHGFRSSYKEGPGGKIWKSIINRPEKLNLLAVDWSDMAQSHNSVGGLCYQSAVDNIPQVAIEVIDFMRKEKIEPSNTLLICHSLGSHVCREMVQIEKSFSGEEKPFQKIYYLDAASFLIKWLSDLHPLSQNDAKEVIAVHTSTSNIVLGRRIGIRHRIGSIDIYPNGGVQQNGCSVSNLACSHTRSIEIMAEMLEFKSSKVFRFWKCTSIEEAENHTCTLTNTNFELDLQHHLPTGIFYIKTNFTQPLKIDERIPDENQ